MAKDKARLFGSFGNARGLSKNDFVFLAGKERMEKNDGRGKK